MIDSTHFLLHRELQRYDGQCNASASLVRRARSLDEVIRQMDAPSLAPWARGLAKSVRGPGQLARAAEERAKELVDLEVKKLEDPAASEETQARVRSRMLPLLRGRFPQLAVQVAEAVSKSSRPGSTGSGTRPTPR